jgi:hypothetical protein
MENSLVYWVQVEFVLTRKIEFFAWPQAKMLPFGQQNTLRQNAENRALSKA